MIGPHQDKELELMLAGKKNFSVFCEAVIENQEIPETIIPDKAFLPYVEKGIFARFSKDFLSPKMPYPARYVCYTVTGQEWRAKAFLWMHQECLLGNRPFDDAYEFFVGRLLDYEEADIVEFIAHRKLLKSAPLTEISKNAPMATPARGT